MDDLGPRRGPTVWGSSSKNSGHKVFARQIDGIKRSFANIPFNNIRLQGDFNPNMSSDGDGSDEAHPCPVKQIVVAKAVIFALNECGICAAFNRDSRKRLCCLNLAPDQVIIGLVFNSMNVSVITVYKCSDDVEVLRCKTFPIQYIQRRQPDAGFPIFEIEPLEGFTGVQFHILHGKAITHASRNMIYRVYELKNYKFLYSIPDTHVSNICISDELMLVVCERVATGHLSLKLLSTDGTVAQNLQHMLPGKDEISVLHYFNEKLFLQQKEQEMLILDIRKSQLTAVTWPEFQSLLGTRVLEEHRVVLTFCSHSRMRVTTRVLDLDGQLLTKYSLPWLYGGASNIFCTHDERTLITYGNTLEGGKIYITDALSGKRLAEICATDPTVQVRKEDAQNRGIVSTAQQALDGITAIFYDEDRHELYTGNQLGWVHVWSN